METKEVKIQVPEGYEIDKENSTFECIKFKSIKNKFITYKDICNELFKEFYYDRDSAGNITVLNNLDDFLLNKNNNTKQLEKLFVLNQLINIAEYYNKQHPKQGKTQYYIIKNDKGGYDIAEYQWLKYILGVVALFNKKEDAQEVIDNPNFREILDMVYKN